MKRIFLKGIVLVVFCVMTGLLMKGSCSDAKEQWDTKKSYMITNGGFRFHTYLSADGKKAWVHEVEIQKNVNVPEKFVIPEKLRDAVVVKIGAWRSEDCDGGANIFGGWEERFHGIDGSTGVGNKIKRISMPDTITEIEIDTFCAMGSLEKVEIPDKVSELKWGTFADCNKLKEVKLPENLSKFDSHCFENCNQLKKVTLSSKNKTYTLKKNVLLKNGKKNLCWVVPNHKTIRIPDSVYTVETDAFADSQATKVVFGKNVKKFQGNSFTGTKIKEIVIGKNTCFAKHKGCIYRKKDKTLAIGIAKKRKLVISNRVKRLTRDVSICGELKKLQSLKVLDIPASVNWLGKEWLRYMGFSSTDKTYFRGKKPPRLQKSNSEYANLPVFGKIYVPKKSLKAYQAWYKRTGELEYVEEDDWYTI